MSNSIYHDLSRDDAIAMHREKGHCFNSFGSPEEHADFIRPHIETYTQYEFGKWRNDWYRCNSVVEGLAKLDNGDSEAVEAAQKIMDEFNDQHVQTRGLPILERQVVGYIPHVPSAIINLPKSMLRHMPSDFNSTRTPVRIFVDVGVSDGVSLDHLMNRGVAAIALTMALQRTRPVELHAISALSLNGRKTQITTTRISNTPIDLNRAAAMLSHAAITRRVSFYTAMVQADYKYNVHTVAWAFSSTPTNSSYIDTCKSLVGATDKDVWITGGYLDDKLMLKNPIQWVKNMINSIEHTERDE